MRLLGLTTLAVTAAVTAGLAALTHADPAPAPAPQEGTSRIEQLRLGEYWFGPEIDHEDLVGKVVLVEIWGS